MMNSCAACFINESTLALFPAATKISSTSQAERQLQSKLKLEYLVEIGTLIRIRFSYDDHQYCPRKIQMVILSSDRS